MICQVCQRRPHHAQRQAQFPQWQSHDTRVLGGRCLNGVRARRPLKKHRLPLRTCKGLQHQMLTRADGQLLASVQEEIAQFVACTLVPDAQRHPNLALRHTQPSRPARLQAERPPGGQLPETGDAVLIVGGLEFQEIAA